MQEIKLTPEHKNRLLNEAGKFLNAKEKRRIALDQLMALMHRVREHVGGDEITVHHYMECGVYGLANKYRREIKAADRVMDKMEGGYHYAKAYGLID